ncbi:hypothetical protein HY772_02670 [Candidatus Woesearchaeota archaeon]|nr:hypothetical protein [Candidatus Woesearchaeota archaeon]
MKLHIPNSAFLGNIDAFLRTFDSASPDHLEITFNKKWSSVHPVVLCMSGALGTFMKENRLPIRCEQPEAKSKHYLERMGLNNILGITAFATRQHEPAGRFIPLTQIKTSEELSAFITDMIPLLHTTPEQAEPIKYVISELVRNVLEHAQSTIGAIVCAQFFKKSNRISIGVVDVGVGIKRTITVAHPANNDIAAIKLALTPGITGSTTRVGGTEANAGAGLFFTKSIAKVNRDFFVLYSGHGLFKLLKTPAQGSIKLHASPDADKSSMRNDLPYWQGTVVGIDISLDRHRAFDDLLDLIRSIYRTGTKEKRKEKFKKVRFI